MRANRLCALWIATVVLAGCAEFEPTTELVIPLDERPAVRSEVTPPPVSGGTLLALQDDVTVVAADPDRDRVSVVNLQTRVVTTIPLERGDEPGRVIEGLPGVVFVALRGGDAVAEIDVRAGAVRSRRETCAEPRGLGYRAAADELWVACASGSLISFVGGEGTPSRVLELGPDLRDVIVRGEDVLVTRFKSAELLQVTTSGEATVLGTPPEVVRRGFTAEGEELTHMTPAMAWRAVQAPDGGTLIVHQRGQTEEVSLAKPTPAQPSSYGGGGGGGGFACSGIVEGAVSMIDDTGAVRTSPGLVGTVLPVDVAVSRDGRVAIANAGFMDPETPRPFVRQNVDDGSIFVGAEPPPEPPVALPSSGLVVIDTGVLNSAESVGGFGCEVGLLGQVLAEPVTAVAFTPGRDGAAPQLLAQTREPARLHILDERGGPMAVVDLGGEPRADTGHDLFHRDTGAGIACASCHGEGAEDGRVWTFAGLGPRRTQALHVGLAGTAPFHWDGELRDLDHLMNEVFVGRMGGVHQSESRLEVLQDYLFALEAPTPMVPATDPAVARGQEIFARADCASCHAGEGLTSSGSFDVGTGGRFQVPSLVGIAYRAPFLHDGCAETLRQRFDPSCGGEIHGDVASLTDTEVDDLVTYLQSL